MSEKLISFLSYVPFVSMAVKHKVSENVMFTRIVESLIIAVMSGVLASAITVRDLTKELNIRREYIEKRMDTMDDRIDKNRDNVMDIMKLLERDARNEGFGE